MTLVLWMQDIILYVVVLAGIVLYVSTLAHKHRESEEQTLQLNNHFIRKAFVFVLAISFLFVVGMLHQMSILVGYISWIVITIAAVLSFFALLWIRRMPTSNKE